MAKTDQKPLLEVKNLKTHFFTEDGVVHAVDGVDFAVYPGEILGLVGESGCGKSVTSLSVMRLISPPGRILEGEILLDGENLLSLSEDEMLKVRGNRIAMIFQQPQTSLNPVFKVGDQIAEVLSGIPNNVALVGHADSIPIHNSRFQNNWELSAARSLSLLTLLINQYGIPESRLSLQSYGSNTPRSSNDTEAGRAENRRVEILILDDTVVSP